MKLHRSVARIRLVFGLMALILCTLLAACGGESADAPAESEAAEEADAERGVPTMPAANFAQPTTQIGGSSDASEPVTNTEMLTTTENLTETDSLTGTSSGTSSGAEAVGETPEPSDSAASAASVDEEPLARGESAYSRQCAECHGADAAGVEGSGNSLIGISLSESEFSTLLRTGGDLGSEHLFGPQRISPGSLEALYVYLQSLSAE